MKRKIYGLALCLSLVFGGTMFTGCSKDSGDPDNGGAIKPDANVPDPTGTITLSMRNDDDTSLNGLYIGKDDNFHGYGWTIATVGGVRGLGNVASIPLAGWSEKVSVTPGNGYVAYNSNTDEYYRIFVDDYITGATTGGIIGADIRYQRPFKGLDEVPMFDVESVVLAATGGSEEIIFTNNSVIPFKVTSSDEWCRVERASTRDEAFLYDGIVISADETYSATSETAVVTIETLFGKKKEIQVTREARGEFITLSQPDVTFDWSGEEQSFSMSVYTNIEPSDIKVASSADWVKAEITGRDFKPQRRVRWIEGRSATRAALENPVSKELYVTVQPNAESVEREAEIRLSYGNVVEKLRIVQLGTGFYLSTKSLDFGAESDLTQQVEWSGNVGTVRFAFAYEYAAEEESWCTASADNRYITVTVQPNPYTETRIVTIKIMYTDIYGTQTQIGTLNVRQSGMEYTDQYVYFDSSSSNESLVFPLPANAKITSSADWCTATPSGHNLVVRATSTTEDRSAVISVSGVDAKIYVSQSKYKVGDDYAEGTVSGRVYAMKDGNGWIVKDIDGRYAWSTENVNLAGLSYTNGEANMEEIKRIPGWKELYPAFAVVDAVNDEQNTTGWYLPTGDEYRLGNNINYGYSYFWTSVSVSNEEALYVYNHGTSFSNNSSRYKKSESYVVAMKRFSYDFNSK